MYHEQGSLTLKTNDAKHHSTKTTVRDLQSELRRAEIIDGSDPSPSQTICSFAHCHVHGRFTTNVPLLRASVRHGKNPHDVKRRKRVKGCSCLSLRLSPLSSPLSSSPTFRLPFIHPQLRRSIGIEFLFTCRLSTCTIPVLEYGTITRRLCNPFLLILLMLAAILIFFFSRLHRCYVIRLTYFTVLTPTRGCHRWETFSWSLEPSQTFLAILNSVGKEYPCGQGEKLTSIRVFGRVKVQGGRAHESWMLCMLSLSLHQRWMAQRVIILSYPNDCAGIIIVED